MLGPSPRLEMGGRGATSPRSRITSSGNRRDGGHGHRHLLALQSLVPSFLHLTWLALELAQLDLHSLVGEMVAMVTTNHNLGERGDGHSHSHSSRKKRVVTMAMDIFPLLEKGVVMVIDIFTFSLEKGEGDKKEGALLVAN